MKANKLLKTLAASTMSLALLAGVTVMPAMAAAPEVTITKSLTVTNSAPAYVVNPATSFTFAIGQGTDVPGGENTQPIVAGPAGGAYFAEGADTITFAPSTAASDSAARSKTTQISFDMSKFTAPGIYRYTVTETKGTYDGMSYDETSYNMDVYVVNGTGGLEIATVLFEGAEGDAKTNATFTNTYTTNNLTITKRVTGSQGDKNNPFEFTVTVNGQEGEKFTMVDGTTTKEITSGEKVTFDLKDGESVTIYGLSAGDTYTVDETDANENGYTTSVNGNETGSINTDTTVTYTNDRDPSTPTGVIMNVAPYALMVVIAVAGVAVFMRKRVED